MVFRAKVIQTVGKPYERDGKKYTGLVLASVTHNYWGLPWYWPNVILINGGFFCGIWLAEGDEYLVSGYPIGYGEVDVSGCSRTEPIANAQVDLRTLDGSHCTGPGGTLIGKLYSYDGKTRTEIPRPNETVSLTGETGQSFTAISDSDGVIELRHLRAGTYRIESKLTSSAFIEKTEVKLEEGACIDISRVVQPYTLRGHILGLKKIGRWNSPERPDVELFRADGKKMESDLTAKVMDDGSYYFKDVPPGDYLLGVNLTAVPHLSSPFAPTYCPGTTDPKRATKIAVANNALSASYDFRPQRLVTVDLPVIVHYQDGKLVPEWYADLELNWPDDKSWTSIYSNTGWSTGAEALVGFAGQRHRVYASEGPKFGEEYGTEKCSDPIELVLKPGAKRLDLVVNHTCKDGR